MIRIVIADDHTVIRTGLSMILNQQEDLEVVATVSDGLEAYQMVAKFQPDVLLLDISMPPGESGLITTGKISEQFPKTKILIFTMHDDQEYLFHLLKNGATGYILKNASEQELIFAIRTVYRGGTYIHSEMTTSLVREFVKTFQEVNSDDPFSLLSNRELEILSLVAKGYGNKDIAKQLFISVKTVEVHKGKIMEKLALKSRPELVQYALKKKLLDF